MTVFVNERPVTVRAGARVADAVAALNAGLAAAVAAGRAAVTDGVGRDVPADLPLVAGSILKVRVGPASD